MKTNTQTKPSPKLKRGDWNKAKTKQFWAMHPSGREMWVTPERMEKAVLTMKMKW
jgi:hypothetical protein